MVAARKIFFIGTGNMGGAILRALTDSGYPAESVFFYEPNEERANEIVEKSKAAKITDLTDGFSRADVVFLCIKPQIFSKISASLNTDLRKAEKGPIIISIMAGVSVDALRAAFPDNKDIVRTMPNIAISVKKGIVAIATENVEESILQTVEFLFSMCATTMRVSETQMDAVTGLSGSGPAFAAQFIDALAMGGVKAGLSMELAMKLALAVVEGSVGMLNESGLSTRELIVNVCSPAGTTISGIQELESRGFKGTVMAAVDASVKRSVELRKS